MEGQPYSESLNNVVRLPSPAQRGVETINGIPMQLGRMSLLELQLLERQCAERVEEAKTDLWIIRDVIANHTDDGGLAS